MSSSVWKKEQYRIRRERLVFELGSRCCICGATEALELDHPFGREWTTRQLNKLMRIIRYEEDHAVGNLRLLCSHCNKVYQPKTPF